MTHNTIKLPRGGCANGRAYGQDITLYISNGGAVYCCTVKNYNSAPEIATPHITAYCDEICPLPCGGHIERRANIMKVKY